MAARTKKKRTTTKAKKASAKRTKSAARSRKPAPKTRAAGKGVAGAALTLEQRAASRLIVGFDGTEMTPELGALVDTGISGVILFRRNVQSPEQVARLNADIVRRAKRPFFVSVDQEGGPVQRMRAPFTEFPPHGVLGKIDDADLTHKVASVMARELKAIGFNVDYAPVADVNTNPQNPVIGIRSFGDDPEKVACHVKAWIRGMQGAGVMACAKHFPGHGDTSTDSHYALPSLPHGRERIDAIELVPFRASIKEKVGSIMTAHVVFQAIDPRVPATLSPTVLTGLLRKELKYGGLVISDDLEMKAVADHWGVPEAAVVSLEAGADILLVCKTRDLVLGSIESIAKALESKRLDERASAAVDARLAAARARFLRKQAPANASDVMRVVGCSLHKDVASEVARRASEAGIAWAPPTPAASSPVSTT